MRFWFLVKLVAGLAVAGVLGFTAMLAYHIAVEPLDGIFAKWLPNPGEILNREPERDLVRMLDAAEMPDFEPGDIAFQKAHELLALGRIDEARTRLNTILHIFPRSSAAASARRIVGEINLDEILSTRHMEGKQIHVIRRGDSYLGIAGKYRTTLEMIQHLNGLMEFRNLQPGDELVVMPLDFRLLIEPSRMALSLWQDGRFIREYPMVLLKHSAKLTPQRTTIGSKTARIGNRTIQPLQPEYRGAEKLIQLARIGLSIRPHDEEDEDDIPPGIHLHRADLEELHLLTRPGNEVEIR